MSTSKSTSPPLKFMKVEGLGNDFIMVDSPDAHHSDAIGAHAAALCDRRRGVGADGVICVLPPSRPGADFRMRIFNADGSEAEMCGNGVRCFGEYLSATGRSMDKFTIDTMAGLIEVEFLGADGLGGYYRVNMGLPRFAPDDVPVVPIASGDLDFLMREVAVLDRTLRLSAVSMGNPHAVIFAEELDDGLVLTYGPAIQEHAFFPRSVNVEFVRIISSDEVRMRVYERGCGETEACGTGACAAVVAGVACGLLGNDVVAHLPGGQLRVSWDGDRSHPVYMSGPARAVFSGEVAGGGGDR